MIHLINVIIEFVVILISSIAIALFCYGLFGLWGYFVDVRCSRSPNKRHDYKILKKEFKRNLFVEGMTLTYAQCKHCGRNELWEREGNWV